MQKSNIHPSILQPFFESAKNAADKGQAQWFTPPEWGRLLSLPLNKFRPVITDLSCGNGQLLKAARFGRSHTLGCDIQAGEDHVAADLTRFYPLLHTIGWTADCFVLNPPWDLHWHRDRLDAQLANSDCVNVQMAWLEDDPRIGKAQIDSTVATLMIALDRMTSHGEGFLIGNEATLQRLILGPTGTGRGAPHGALAQHVWAHLVVEGNICAKANAKFAPMQTGILWFARGHDEGLKDGATGQARTIAEAEAFTKMLRDKRRRFRDGPETADYLRTKDTIALWAAAAEEWARVNPHTAARKPQWNLWLDHGYIRTNLSLYDTASGRVTKDEAAKLDELNGTEPMKLVVMREQRRALQTAAFGSTWRVSPELQAAVQKALDDFNAERTPLYPLPKIQRLGFLDEHDFTECLVSFDNFKAGVKYALRSCTVLVKRQSKKMNLWGVSEDTELDGQELAFFIRDGLGEEKCFMEGRLREPGVTVHLIKAGLREALARLGAEDLTPCPIDYTVAQLIEHFDVPEVPDVAKVFPDEYKANLDTLDEIERLVNA